MVEEIFTTGVNDEDLSNLALQQMQENGAANEDSQQIIKTLQVINALKVTVLVVIGFIIRKYQSPKNNLRQILGLLSWILGAK